MVAAATGAAVGSAAAVAAARNTAPISRAVDAVKERASNFGSTLGSYFPGGSKEPDDEGGGTPSGF